MTIPAKYESRCTQCNCTIRVGEQIEWVRGQHARHAALAQCDAARTLRDDEIKQREANAPLIDLTSIVTFITAAKDRGLKRPKLRVLMMDGNTELRLALTVTGIAPGSISLVSGSGYLGSVRPNGRTTGQVAALPELQEHLLKVARDPAAAAKEYAAVMCVCSFCGKALTDAGSVEVGYGPICAKHWGLPHSALGTTILRPVPR